MLTSIRKNVLRVVDPMVRLPMAGLDISDRAFKYIKLRFGRRTDVEFFDEIDIPAGVIERGEIKNEEALTGLLKNWRRRQNWGLRSALVVVSLPEEKSFLRVVQLPKLAAEQVGHAIRWEIESNIPLPPEEVVFDHEVIAPPHESIDHTDVVITAFPKNIVEAYVRVLKQAGFSPAALELESQAIIRAVAGDVTSLSARLVVDMGSNRTSFIIFAGSAILFTTTIELGGKALEESIQKSMGVDEKKAILLKKEVGMDRVREDGKVFTALIPPLGAMADELKRTMEYYSNHAEHAHGASGNIDEVLLTGGDANLAGLATYLASSLGVPVRMADPFQSFSQNHAFQIPTLHRNRSLAFTTAIGLALRGLR